MKEVFINKQRVDLRPDNKVEYIFTSPIFREITQIVANRTSTFKVPKTAHNCMIFGMVDQPDVISDIPKREYLFEEYRSGLLFISGKCQLLKAIDDDFELCVYWGNAVNLLAMKDLRLRDCTLERDEPFVIWNSGSSFLKSSEGKNHGFVVADYGKGLKIDKHMRPAISVRGILDIIEKSTGAKFQYDKQFNDVFEKKWIPLFDTNADEFAWRKNGYQVEVEKVQEFLPPYVGKAGEMGFWLPLVADSENNKRGMITNHGFVKWTSKDYSIGSKIRLKARVTSPARPLEIKLSWCQVQPVWRPFPGNYYLSQNIETINSQTARLVNWEDGIYETIEMDSTNMAGNYSDTQHFVYAIITNGVLDPGFELEIENLEVTIKEKEVKFGEVLPIIPNLPDMKVLDFLKALMHMYGLYAHFDARKDNFTVRFVSINDIYKDKSKAYDWTNKLVSKDRKMQISYTYGDYARKNYLRYAADDSVSTNADGEIAIDNDTITDEKTIVELPFAPSDNNADDNGKFASIKLFDGDNKNSPTLRILNRGEYRDESEDINYISAIFDGELSFSDRVGLLNKYYSSFQRILKNPVVVEFEVMLDEFELYTYSEVTPVYIEGVYYMVLSLTASEVDDGKSLCKCKAIRMSAV